MSDAELNLIKATFAGRDSLYITLRNLFLGLEVSKEECEQVKKEFASPALRTLMRKQFLPEFVNDVPIGQNIDMYMLVDIRGKTQEQIEQEVGATEWKKTLIERALSTLEDPEKWIDVLSFEKSPLHTQLAGRNLFVNHIDRQLQTIEVLAGQPTETVEATKERLMKDSSK